MGKKRIDTASWMIGQTVIIDNRSLRIVAAHHEDRGSTFSLVDQNGNTYRYASPLKLHRTN
jgi:hypothetical protein